MGLQRVVHNLATEQQPHLVYFSGRPGAHKHENRLPNPKPVLTWGHLLLPLLKVLLYLFTFKGLINAFIHIAKAHSL